MAHRLQLRHLPRQLRAMSSSVNTTSQTSFNSNHALYDQVRPSFPPAAVDALVGPAMLNLVPGKSKVLEVACGTGKFTRALVDRGIHQGGRLLASDPSGGMLESFRQNFGDQVTAVQASVYDLAGNPQIAAAGNVTGSEVSEGQDGQGFDAVIAAQAFHWFGTAPALRHLASVLCPRGKLGLVWNYEDMDVLPASNWQKRVTEYIWSFDAGVPQYRHLDWIAAFTTPDGENGGRVYFETPYTETHVKTEVGMPRDMVWPYWASRSYITALPREKQDEARKYVEQIVHGEIPKEDLTEDGELVVRRGTHVVCARKLPN